MKRVKYYVRDHSTGEILIQNATRKDAEFVMKHCKNKKYTRMYMESHS